MNRLRVRRWFAAAGRTGVYAVLAAASCSLAFLLRFDMEIPAVVAPMLLPSIAAAAICKTAVFHLSGVDRERAELARLSDLGRLFMANFLAEFPFAFSVWFAFGRSFPRSIYLLDLFLCWCLATAFWMLSSVFGDLHRLRHRPATAARKRVLIYGAGEAGSALASEIRHDPALPYEVAGFLDDDHTKLSTRLHSVPVLGLGRDAAQVVSTFRRRHRPIDQIVICMPSATGRQMQDALANSRMSGLPCRTLPGTYELLEKQVLSSQIRDVAIEDLLGRAEVHLEPERIAAQLWGKVVLITGAGGSIGAELCRQVARFEPKRLVIFDQAESDLFHIENELRALARDLDLQVELGSIANRKRLQELLKRHRVEVVYHAAAYKHVPMLEHHPVEGAANNVLGTWNLVNTCLEFDVRRFLMISTDKAVNPTSFMGASKRACELLVSARSAGSRNGGECMAVRFGNVLGSNGSVVPIFRRQIAQGGPVTVTHPDMKRYFMCVSEAAQLSLQASVMGHGGEIFVLDMGEPVPILRLAENMIRLSGRVPYEDIDIHFTGLRPGEKLFEEIRLNSEKIVPTCHPRIHVFHEEPRPHKEIEAWIAELQHMVEDRREAGIRAHLMHLVPEYQGPPHVTSTVVETPRTTPAGQLQEA